MQSRLLRQGRLLALFTFCFCAMTILPRAAQAQDVIALPPSTASPSASSIDTTTPDAAPADAVPPSKTTAVPTMLPMPTVPAQPIVSTTVKMDPQFFQCVSDADCVLTSDGCSAFDAVNKNYVANWRSAIPHDPECQPVFALTKGQQTMQAACSGNMCGVRPPSGK